jgi:hypothetical protein
MTTPPILIKIDTEYDGQGVSQARADTGALANETKARVDDVSDSTSRSIEKIPRAARTGAAAFGTLTEAAILSKGNLFALSNVAGDLAKDLAELSGSAELAAGAAGIGAMITLLGVAIATMKEFDSETKESSATQKLVAQSSLEQLDRIIGDQRRRVEEARVAAEGSSMWKQVGHDIDDLIANDRWDRLRAFWGSLKQLGGDTFAGDTRALKDYLDDLTVLNDMEGHRRDLEAEQGRQLKEQVHTAALRNADQRDSLEIEQMKTGVLHLQAMMRDQDGAIVVSQREQQQRQIDIEAAARERAIREQFRFLDAKGLEIPLGETQQRQLDDALQTNKDITAQQQGAARHSERDRDARLPT